METSVRVDKIAIINTLKVNRVKHLATYEKAMKGYREKAIASLEQKIKELRAGLQPELWARLPVPRDHTRDYDTAIAMFEASVDDTITIGFEDFRRYAYDSWEWRSGWLSTTSQYTEST